MWVAKVIMAIATNAPESVDFRDILRCLPWQISLRRRARSVKFRKFVEWVKPERCAQLYRYEGKEEPEHVQ